MSITKEEASALCDALTYEVEESVCRFFEQYEGDYDEDGLTVSVRTYDDLFFFVTEDGTYGSMKGVQIVPAGHPAIPVE